MSLLKLKSKTEPLYTNKSIIIFIGKLINTWFDIIREKLRIAKYA